MNNKQTKQTILMTIVQRWVNAPSLPPSLPNQPSTILVLASAGTSFDTTYVISQVQQRDQIIHFSKATSYSVVMRCIAMRGLYLKS